MRCRTLVDVLELRSGTTPDALAYRFLSSSGAVEGALTYGALQRRARVMATHLARHASVGDRVMILLPAGLDYVTALYACQYAGVIGVPAYAPSVRRPDARVEGIAADCEARAAIVSPAYYDRRAERVSASPGLGALDWLNVRDVSDGDEIDVLHSGSADDLAFLQYTSGSTGTPRGVMLGNRNMLHNLGVIRTSMPQRDDDSYVFWVPPYHDMGLIGGILLPLFVGAEGTLMSASTFSQRPYLWLRALTEFRGTYSAAPNFAYDLCVSQVSEEERATLDLSQWSVATNGAEPVRAETLDRFSAAFQSCGFRRSAFFPSYGLAETTLFVSGGCEVGERRAPLPVDRADLERGCLSPPAGGAEMLLVSAGKVGNGVCVAIVDPECNERVAASRIGEVWVSSESIALGYWGKPAETTETFQATLAGDSRRWLRTGDLGVMHQGELFVTGRLKDLLIVEGRNIYPQDVEQAAEHSHPLVRRSGVAAFATGSHAGDVIVVAEVARSFRATNQADVVSAIRDAIALGFGIRLDDVVLIRFGTLARTSSGKVQRGRTRERYEARELSLANPRTADRDAIASPPIPRALPFLEAWLTEEMQLPPGIVDGTNRLRELGLDSLAATRLLVALERQIGKRVDPALLWRSATLGEFAAALDGERLDGDARACAMVDPNPQTSPVEQWPEVRALKHRLELLGSGAGNGPFFLSHDGISGATASIGGRDLLNFANYNYLGLNGHPAVTRAAHEASDRYGTSVSASRVVSGERPLHAELENSLAGFLGTESSLVFVGGHATNVSILTHLFGPGDLILCDALMHNSALQGAAFSGARWLTFSHNSWEDCAAILGDIRAQHRRAIIVIEGAYSADGDVPDLARFIEIKERFGAMLMVDEAHSLGVLGASGRGIAEAFGIDASRVDILMGTLSKTLASCGGYIAGSSALVEYLKYTAPGFVYSVGITPPNAAAALAALRVLDAEPDRVRRLQENSVLFASLAREAGLDVGASAGSAVVPVIVGDSWRAVRLSQALFVQGINVQPMISPAVPNDAARLRFFISCEHTREQMETAVRMTARLIADEFGEVSAGHRPPQLAPAT